ncbi:unnamed protein product [Peniophora sp. CBMAI 1063]|nr:unnamed protein product [Peniophora sp. CBMAI 1063]
MPATIHRLSPETLAAIFSLVAQSSPPRRINLDYLYEGLQVRGDDPHPLLDDLNELDEDGTHGDVEPREHVVFLDDEPNLFDPAIPLGESNRVSDSEINIAFNPFGLEDFPDGENPLDEDNDAVDNELVFYRPRRRLRCRAYSLGFIKLSHVCGSWRALALSLPTLWAGAVYKLPHPNAIETMVGRARDAPLSISTIPVAYTKERERNAAICRFAFGRTRQIHSLRLHFGRKIGMEFDWRARESLSLTPLPNLSRLSLSLYDAQGQDTPPIDAPNLKSATLRGAWCRFESQDLRYLNYTVNTSQSESIIRLLDILHSTPLLRTLRLTVIHGSLREDDVIAAKHSITLPNLDLFCVSFHQRGWSDDHDEDLTAFFRVISLPTSCSVHVHDSRHADDWPYSLDACGHLLSHGTYDAVGFYSIEEWKGGFYASAFDQAHPPKSDRETHFQPECCERKGPAEPLRGQSIRLQITPAHHALKAMEVLPRVMSHLQPTAITYLALDGMHEEDVTALRIALRSFTAVKTLVARLRLNYALRALCSDAEGTEPPLPALEKLTVTHYGIQSDWEDRATKWWMELVGALEDRMGMGLSVRKLHLVGGWKPRDGAREKNTFFRAPTQPSAYAEAMERDKMLTKEAERDGLARARELVDELVDERVM